MRLCAARGWSRCASIAGSRTHSPLLLFLRLAAVCPNDCSGHGTCQSEQRFVTDAGITLSNGKVATYSGAYDRVKEFGCKCDVGYRGGDCSQSE